MENIHNFCKNVKSLPLYTKLFSKKFKTSDEFIDQITDPEHQFFGAARDVAKEILSRAEGGQWKWLSYRIDDIGGIVEQDVSKKIQKWRFKAILGNGKMPMDTPAATIKWLFERMLSEYKNIFEEKRANFLDLRKADKILKLETLNQLQTSLEWEEMA